MSNLIYGHGQLTDPGMVGPATPQTLPPLEQGPQYVQAALDRITDAAQRMALIAADLASTRIAYRHAAQYSAETDASGNLALKTYECPAGMICMVHRVVVDVAGQAPGSAAIASAWIRLQVNDTGTSTVPVGNLIDFAPPSGTTSLSLPAKFTAAANEGGWLRTGDVLYVRVGGSQAGLASKQVVARVQCVCFEQGGRHAEMT